MPPGPPMPPPIVAALDKDDDGIISAQEIADSPDSLKTLDKNGDGQLTPDEYFGPKPDGRKHSGGGNSGTSGSSSPLSATTSGTSGMGHTMDPPNSGKSGKKHHGPPLQLVEALDANADGVISADEITNAPAALKTLDKNNDGQLGPREYGPKPPPLPKELEPYDTNGNGRIDPDEMAAVQADIKSGKLKLPPPPQGGPGQADE
jgi:Ca2+-binding EF-hand superfamily protein